MKWVVVAMFGMGLIGCGKQATDSGNGNDAGAGSLGGLFGVQPKASGGATPAGTAGASPNPISMTEADQALFSQLNQDQLYYTRDESKPGQPIVAVSTAFGGTLTLQSIQMIAKFPSITSIRLKSLTKPIQEHLPLLRNQLTELDFTEADFGDEHLPFLKSFPKLTHLNLNETKITEAGLSEIAKLTQLTHLSLVAVVDRNDNALGDGIAVLAALPRLESLDVSITRLSDAGLAKLGTFPALKVLKCQEIAITGKGFAGLTKLKNLTELDVGQVGGMTDAYLTPIGNLSNLTKLDLSGTNLGENAMKAIGKCTKLTDLKLGVQLNGRLMQELSGLTQLTTLSVNGTEQGDELIPIIARFPNLKSLTLTFVNVSDRGVAALANARSLEVCKIDECELTDASLATFAKLPNLTELSITGAILGDNGVSALASAPKLTRLTLRGKALSDAAEPALSRLTQLKQLKIGGPKVTEKARNSLRQTLKIDIGS
ncbi:leucine-rich repeat domain-containing protein [Tuwongella immobilis]|nr:hypothetical protein [Tuwongella immobilis]